MTSPNWYDQEPYLERVTCVNPAFHQFECSCPSKEYNVPLIIKKVKEIEQEREYHINCRNCGASTSFSPNDLNPHQQVDNE